MTSRTPLPGRRPLRVLRRPAHPPGVRRRRRLGLAAAVVGVALVAPLLPASGEEEQDAVPPGLEDVSWSFQGEGDDRVQTADFREGAVAPTAAQQAAARNLGATTVRWNDFGTPHLMMNNTGYLSGPRAGSAAQAARAFVQENRDLFGLDADTVADLEVLVDSPLYDSPDYGRAGSGEQPRNTDVPHVVTFRQTFGDLVAAQDGLITLGVQRDGRIAYVTSSVSSDDSVGGTQRLDPVEAITAAADDAGLDLGELTASALQGPWQTFTSALSRDLQRARLMVLPTPRDGLRLVWEATVLRADHTELGAPAAFISFVDAETGEVLYRDNRLDHLADGMSASPSMISLPALPQPEEPVLPGAPTPFTGATDAAGSCTPTAQRHPVTVEQPTGQIAVVVATTVPDGTADDITVNLYRAGVEQPVASQDLLTSPEALTYQPAGGVQPGEYLVEVCEFAPSPGSIAYTGVAATGPAASVEPALPSWRVFPSNPFFVDDPRAGTDSRELWCWVQEEGCDEEQTNVASRLPWDVLAPSIPTLSTMGNNAWTAISEVSFLTPDTIVQRPVTPSRDYDYPWNDTWHESSCDPTTFDQPGGNDDDASVANLFVMHNRMHDWSYYLGFTETNSNLQVSNFGNTGPNRENDPEIGNAQAGRRTFNGRDNANQITLQDGIAPITNQYLWQPLAGAFYAACTDGAYDMAVVAHEYGHAISNRMVAGPDTGTGNTQGQTESWSDLIFAEYFRGYGISTGEGANSLALAPYVSGNKQRGIRNYAMDTSPLNYSNLGYDGNGSTSPHSDGEIWSATNHDLVRALNARYDARFPSSDRGLQLRCAKGELPGDLCPGNRRWAHLLFDGLLLNPSGSTMLDSRDAILAADRLRFDGANQDVLWRAFAKRGMGASARSTNAEDRDPVPGWTSPLDTDQARVNFLSNAPGTRVFVGNYEARTTPVADNIATTATPGTVRFTPGTYRFIATAPGHGAVRFSRTLRPGEGTSIRVPLRRNLASAASGATATGDGVNLESLIDDTESTNWASLASDGTASEGLGEGRQVEGRQATVALGRTPVRIASVQVSAALRPTIEDDADAEAQSRFSALRSFDILVCDATVAGNTCQDDPSEFRVAYRSTADAFPGVRPRPAAPDLTLRTFTFPTMTGTHVRLRVRDNQCTGGPEYQGDTNPSNDPVFSNPDCDSTAMTPDRLVLSPPPEQVRVAELQVFGPR